MHSPASCSWLYEPPQSASSMFRGIFQQDVAHFAGSHQGTDAGQREDSPAQWK